jgi:phosphoribosyl-ATP pyrophosphohydrolase/phosphoribosyl-AMP cyclohydrolase
MVIASIDLMEGKAVQLIGGKEKALERDDVMDLAKEFNKFGQTAIIDLDSALNRGENKEIIKKICGICDCRVGGGIRSREQARELIAYGAQKIIIGSKAFEYNRVNIPFLKDLNQSIGKDRIIVAVDSVKGRIVADGWRRPTGLNVVETSRQMEPFVSELLFTCVEKEGRMKGTDMETIRELKNVFSKPITAAGGVNSLEEIESLANIGVDVQLGMALYTRKIKLDEAFICGLKWQKPLLPAITIDTSGQVLMLAYVNKDSLKKTFETGNMWYYSRSRQRLWRKGETSGNLQKFQKLRADCDRDALLVTVEQSGPACHLENYSCFGDKEFSLIQLYDVIERRFKEPSPGSYTATLTNTKLRQKILEEAGEVVVASGKNDVIWEVADLLYFLLVLLQKEGIQFNEILMELRRRRWR